MTVQENLQCYECQKEAKFYSSYDRERVLFCSAPCHDKHNEKVETKNYILVALDANEDSTDKDIEETDENLSEIFQVCHRGDGNHEKLRTLLEDGEAVDQKNEKGKTLLTYSIVKGDFKTLDVLLGAGADINETDDDGMTPLIVAASIGADQKVAFLIQRDADVALQGKEGKTALHKTDANKDIECAKLLLEQDRTLVNVKDKFDQTAVHVVAGEGNDNVLAALLEYEPNLNDVDNLGRTPLNCSVLQKAEKCVDLLLNYKDGVQDGVRNIDVADRFGFPPLHYAVQANNVKIVEMLVAKGCDINKKDKRGQTALLSAASLGYTDIFKLLLEKCEDKNAVDSKGLSALHHAAAKGETEICNLLIKNGANVNLQDKTQQTCVFSAALNDKKETVKMLIKNGAKCGVGAKDEKGRTPLHHMAEMGNTSMLNLLIDKAGLNADGAVPEEHTINSEDGSKSSVLYIAAFHEHRDCCQVLIEKGVIIDGQSRRDLISMGLIEEEKVEEVEVESTSPRERYAIEPAPTPVQEKIEDLPIGPVIDPQEVANSSRHISPDVTPRRASLGSERKKRIRELRARRLKPFPGHEDSPYLKSNLTEETLYKNNRYLGIRPAYLSRSCTNLDSSSTKSSNTSSSSSSSVKLHIRSYSYSNGREAR